MATLNLGRLKPVFRGAWNNATAYNVDDIVVRNNQSYISIQAGTNQDPATATAYWTLMAAKGSDGTDVGATLANKEIAFKTNAGAVDGIPIGNAGEFLKVNSGATGYEFAAVSSDVVKTASWDYSSSASSVTLSSVFSNDYDVYKVFFINMFADSNTQLEWRLLTSGGSASGDYDITRIGSYADDNGGNTGDTHNTHWNASYVRPAPENVSTSVANSISTELTLINPYKTGKKRHFHMHSFIDAANAYNYQFLAAGFNDDTSNNYTQLQFRFEGGGNVAGGSVRVYGFKN